MWNDPIGLPFFLGSLSSPDIDVIGLLYGNGKGADGGVSCLAPPPSKGIEATQEEFPAVARASAVPADSRKSSPPSLMSLKIAPPPGFSSTAPIYTSASAHISATGFNSTESMCASGSVQFSSRTHTPPERVESTLPHPNRTLQQRCVGVNGEDEIPSPWEGRTPTARGWSNPPERSGGFNVVSPRSPTPGSWNSTPRKPKELESVNRTSPVVNCSEGEREREIPEKWDHEDSRPTLESK